MTVPVPSPRLAVPTAVFVAALLAAPLAEAAPVIEPGARVGLVTAGVVGGRPAVGLEIVLERGWKTYWRSPGDAGMAPRITDAGSRGARLEAVRFPAPIRFDEAGITALGYTRTVILPLDVTLDDPTRTAILDLHVQIGLCKDICVPLDVGVSARIDPTAAVDPAVEARLAQARAAVPVAAAADRMPRVVAIARDGATTPPTVTVTVAMPGGADGDVLVEGPDETWALPVPQRLPSGPGRDLWRFTLDGAPADADLDRAALRFTLRADERAVEQTVALDGTGVLP